MGLFNLFKKPIIIQDEFFGRLRYTKFKNPRDGFFEGEGFFASTNNKIGYTIEAEETGPTEGQREFCRKVQNNFEQYVEKIKPLIEDEFRNWKDDFEITDFKTEFALNSLTIPRMYSNPVLWDMCFTSIHDDNHFVIIKFENDEPKGILIDG